MLTEREEKKLIAQRDRAVANLKHLRKCNQLLKNADLSPPVIAAILELDQELRDCWLEGLDELKAENAELRRKLEMTEKETNIEGVVSPVKEEKDDGVDDIFKITSMESVMERERIRLQRYLALPVEKRLVEAENRLYEYAQAFVKQLEVIRDMRDTLEYIAKGQGVEEIMSLARGCLARNAK